MGKNLSRRLLAGIGLFGLLMFTSFAWAQSSKKMEPFDHAKTGFDLFGAHTFVACEDCHTGGQFQGTPKDCVGCHSLNGHYNATPKPADHIATTNQCEACHHPTHWEDVVRVDHNHVFGNCVLCHNNVVAIGKFSDHFLVSDSCDSCHTDMSFFPAAFDHLSALMPNACETCHDGARARGQKECHMITNGLPCATCHADTSFFANTLIQEPTDPGSFPPGCR